MAACLTKDPDTRPSAEELLKSSFIVCHMLQYPSLLLLAVEIGQGQAISRLQLDRDTPITPQHASHAAGSRRNPRQQRSVYRQLVIRRQAVDPRPRGETEVTLRVLISVRNLPQLPRRRQKPSLTHQNKFTCAFGCAIRIRLRCRTSSLR